MALLAWLGMAQSVAPGATAETILYDADDAGRVAQPVASGATSDFAALAAADGTNSVPEPVGRLLERRRADYSRAVDRARQWLDGLQVDPLDLRRHGLKGKKKLAEILDGYRRLLECVPELERPTVRERVRQLAAVTEKAEYHDMATVGDEEFKQDATSYLRVAYVMDRLGFDTRTYRKEIERVLPRLNVHMVSRGVNQRMAFHLYYDWFQLAEPFPLAPTRAHGVIARRLPADTFAWHTVYDFTHEIFALYAFGDRLEVAPFDADERRYLRDTMEALAARCLRAGDTDLVAELVSCMAYLKDDTVPSLGPSVTYLLERQNADGSWGAYESERAALGDYVRQAYYLHTTMVVLDALYFTYARFAPLR